MATTGRRSDLDLEVDESLRRRLAEEAPDFNFFQAVRLLQRLAPDRENVGTFVSPALEAVRFTANPSLSFPASQLQQIEFAESTAPRMKVNFMGLTGPSGVLPYCYTELIIERSQARDCAAGDFLDIFNHRIISLFYRAWEKYRFTVAYERGERDRIAESLLSLLGLLTCGLQDRQPVPDEALLYYAGLLGQRPRSSTVLQQLLSDYFDVQVAIEQFAGAWFALDPEAQTQLEDEHGGFARLGAGAVVGDAIWSEQSMVRIRLWAAHDGTLSRFSPLRQCVPSAMRPDALLFRG